ncbi:hypothetical protein Drorol1_Dr00005016 [Drosera rotundifolia]
MASLAALPALPALPADTATHLFPIGGLFLDPSIPSSFLHSIPFPSSSSDSSQTLTASNPIHTHRGHPNSVQCSRRRRDPICFLSISLKEDDRVSARPDSSIGECVGEGVNDPGEGGSDVEGKGAEVVGAGKGGVVNSAKHFCAGAAAAMVARTFVAPLERLKLEYIIRGEKRNILELIKAIATTQGLGGFWKGNFLNILRTAPFKAINFCAYDIYRRQLRKFSANEETSNSQKFIAGAAAGITATILCLPLDTVRTSIIATGGEKWVGVFSAFGNIIQNEGFLSLYKGLLPSIISIAPSSAVFYGVYDILKSSFLRSPEGKRRIQKMRQQGVELTALGQLELGPLRTLLYGAIAGACAEAATYPFEVLRRQLQMQVKDARLNTLATFIKIVQQGGIPALYAGVLPSLLQVLPSAATSYFVYEFMKILLKVE